MGLEGSGPVEKLTTTESDTLTMLLNGWSNIQIAAERGVSVNTVKSCVRTILRKYGCSRRGELLAAAIGVLRGARSDAST